jgi:ATP-dependent DNA ligase
MTSILTQLNNIAAVSGNEKLKLLQEYINLPTGELLELAFHATYTTEINYYIRPSVFHHAGHHGQLSLSDAIDSIIDKLAGRVLTGNAAFEYYMSITRIMSADDAEVLNRIMNRDLRCGVSATTANKALRKPIPTFSVMLCGKNDEKNVRKINFKAKPFVQLKSDGLRIIVTVSDNGAVMFRTRNGKEMQFPSLAKQFEQFAGFAFDGEALVKRNGEILDRKTGNGILNSIQKGDMTFEHEVVLVLWDMINLNDFLSGYSNVPYESRFSNLTLATDKIDRVILQESYRVEVIEEVDYIFNEMLARGEEGIILKDSQSPYESKRVNHQLKYKAELDADLLIIGFEEGSGKYTGTLGAIQMESGDGRVKVSVGTGLSDNLRDYIWENKESVIGKIAAVKYNEVITSKGKDTKSLFLPVFIELREDKETADTL